MALITSLSAPLVHSRIFNMIHKVMAISLIYSHFTADFHDKMMVGRKVERIVNLHLNPLKVRIQYSEPNQRSTLKISN